MSLPPPYDQESPVASFKEAARKYLDLCNRGVEWYKTQSSVKKVLIWLAMVLIAVAFVVLALFHAYLIKLLILLADKWADMKFGLPLLFTLLFFVGFPPLLGFSPLSMLAGMVYGIGGGWLLVATASITGSFGSFLVFRYLLKDKSKQLLESNDTFKAFAETIKQDHSLLLLVLIRLCPLPYSLSNGALSAIPELYPLTYLAASIITSPKLLIHIFVGHQLKDIGEEGNTTAKRVIDVVTIMITGVASASTTYIIYHKMQRRLHKYRSTGDGENYSEMIFGDFSDDDSAGNVELDSADFDPGNYDPDNFVISEEDMDGESVQSGKTKPSLSTSSHEPLNSKGSPTQYTVSPVKRTDVPTMVLEDHDDDKSLDLDSNKRSYRDY